MLLLEESNDFKTWRSDDPLASFSAEEKRKSRYEEKIRVSNQNLLVQKF